MASDPLPFHIERQPDAVTCGATCLHALYRHHGLDLPLARIAREIPQLKNGGTHGVMLGRHALRHGFRVEIVTYNLLMFDPTWFRAPGADLRERLARQAEVKNRRGFLRASHHYQKFLDEGGRITMEDLSEDLFRRFLDQGLPLLTGLSSTYLYQEARMIAETNLPDDLRGTPEGHFVVVCGHHAAAKSAWIADPHHPNPLGREPVYSVPFRRLLTAVLLGIVTYDANLVILHPPSPLP